MTDLPQKFLRRDEAAAYVCKRWGQPCSRGLLAKLAVSGDGPLYRTAGRFPLYSESDLDAWAESRLSEPRRISSEDRSTYPSAVGLLLDLPHKPANGGKL